MHSPARMIQRTFPESQMCLHIPSPLFPSPHLITTVLSSRMITFFGVNCRVQHISVCLLQQLMYKQCNSILFVLLPPPALLLQKVSMVYASSLHVIIHQYSSTYLSFSLPMIICIVSSVWLILVYCWWTFVLFPVFRWYWFIAGEYLYRFWYSAGIG